MDVGKSEGNLECAWYNA